MSGLSAKVSSCGGEGALLGLGGEAFGGGAAFLVAFFARWKIGASFFTSSSGADDSPLLSESDIVAVGGWCCCVVFGGLSQSGLVVVVESCKSGRKEPVVQRQRGRLSRTVANGGEGKVNRWEGSAVEQTSIQ